MIGRCIQGVGRWVVMVGTEPALLLPPYSGEYDEIIDSMGLRLPLVLVTKFSSSRGTGGVLSRGSHELTSTERRVRAGCVLLMVSLMVPSICGVVLGVSVRGSMA